MKWKESVKSKLISYAEFKTGRQIGETVVWTKKEGFCQEQSSIVTQSIPKIPYSPPVDLQLNGYNGKQGLLLPGK